MALVEVNRNADWIEIQDFRKMVIKRVNPAWLAEIWRNPRSNIPSLGPGMVKTRVRLPGQRAGQQGIV